MAYNTLTLNKKQGSSIEKPIQKCIHTHIYPIFIPFSGCKTRCVFCAQEQQTNQASNSIEAILSSVTSIFSTLKHNELIQKPFELAFYGGTFTALPQNDLTLCLDFIKKWQDHGLINNCRCSTRPDSISSGALRNLVKAGIKTVELGIQTWADPVLAATNRGYSKNIALNACKTVQDCGATLGIQLMQGLPQQTTDIAFEDCLQTCDLNPSFVRLYPCLVIEGTPLATLWRNNKYAPWSLDETIGFLTQAYQIFFNYNINIIRIGVAPEKELMSHLLAGPYHAALGNIIRSRVIYGHLKNELPRIRFSQKEKVPSIDLISPDTILYAPKSIQGDFWGYKKELLASYLQLGVTPRTVRWWDKEFFWYGTEQPASEG